MEQTKTYPPLVETDEVALGKRCTICSEKFQVGDVTQYINNRPDGPQEAIKYHARQPYRGIADLVHAACVAKKVAAYLEAIQRQRTEILDAFVAKYNCQPDEAVQIQAGNKWLVQRIDEEERKAIRTIMITVEENAKLMADVKLVITSISAIGREAMTPEAEQAYRRLKDWLENPPEKSINVVHLPQAPRC